MTQEVKVDLQLTLEVDCTRTKEDIKALVIAHLINEKCEYIDTIMVDVHGIQEESEIYETEPSFTPCPSCHTFKMCLKQNDCYIDFNTRP